ncbi:MAG: tetratricopeptide repeat protein [Caldilineaceae bacterium]|nr:tetratricopeptide repeat protein [Caldilineaceae bacterium]
MQLPITRTKVVRPRHRPDLLSRPRLLHTLRGLLDRQLILVIAPAGYGKTTALIDFVGTLDMPACWYALSAADRNLHRFAAHFIAAIAQQFPSFGKDSEAALQNLEAGRISFDQFVTLLVNELYAQVHQPYVLVIDDYHLVDDCESIGFFVSQFLQNAGDNCHLILASRTLLTLPDLALLVARGAVDGLDFQELSFQPEELKALARQNYNQVISDAEAEAMVISTEGWITGLLLSANTRQLHMASRMRLMRSSGIDLYGYLAHQVLRQQPPALQDFLLRTSYMDEFDVELCTEVFEPAWCPAGESWESLLDALLHQNLFVTPVGEQGDSVRYHHLFQDFLQRRLQNERPAEVPIILRRLIEVCRQKEQWEQAYLYAERLDDPMAVVRLIEIVGLQMIYSGRILLLQEWLDKFPAPVMRDQPKLLGLQGYCSILLGQVDEGLKRLTDAEKLLRKGKAGAPLAQILAHRSIGHRFLGDYQRSIDDAEAALALLNKLNGTTDGNETQHTKHQVAEHQLDVHEHRRIQALAYRSKGLGFCMQGNLEEGLEWQQRSLELYQQAEDVQNMATLSMEIAITHDNAGQKALAQPLYQYALDAWRELNNPMGQATVLNSLGVFYQEQGEHRQAFTTLTQAIDCARRSGYARMEAFALTGMGDLVFEAGLLQVAQTFYHEAYPLARRLDERFLVLYIELARAALAWSAHDWNIAYECLDAAGRLVLSKNSSYEWGLYRQAMGRYYMAQGSAQQALEPLQDAAACFARGGQTTDEARTRMFLVAAYQAAGMQREAAHELGEALTLTAQLDSQHAVVIVASQMSDLLRAMPVHGPQVGYRRQLLAAVELFQAKRPLLRRDFRHQIRALSPHMPIDPPVLLVRALGRAEVSVNGQPIALSDWKTRVSRDMLFCLLAHPEGLTKEQIGMHFWPDCSPEQLKTRFKNAIYRMRSALNQEVILFEDSIYRLDASLDYEYDVELFLRHVEAGNAASDPAAQIEAYTLALSYYGGSYLPDTEATWSYLERERLRQIYLDTALCLAQCTFQSGANDTALEWCQRVLIEDSCLEDAHRLIMRIYAATGNRAGVARQYTLCQRALQEEIDAPPSAQTEELYALLMH